MAGEKIVILEPLTYMNLSGPCISGMARYFKLDLKDILVICDDINLGLGKVRLRPSGSAGGHNGLDSTITSLGSEFFPRPRIGIESEDEVKDLSEYVLSDFRKSEELILEDILDKVADMCYSWIENGIEATMNKYN